MASEPLPLLVLVGGAPGSGKTTLARRLAVDLAIPLWSKDFVKEALGDGLGWRGPEASKSLGRPTFVAFYRVLGELIRGRVSVIAESNYWHGVSEADLGPISAAARTVQIFCRASPEVCLKRVVERFERGERHPIHAERERLAEAETGVSPADLGQSGGWSRYTPLDLGVPTLVVDTTDGYAPPYEQIVAFATNGRMLPDGLGPIDPTGFQATVAQFVAAHDLDAPLTARVLDLVSEVGEVAKEVLKDSQYGREDFRRTPEWSSELADCFFSLICLANSTGVDLQLGLARALDKYRRRLDRRGDAGSGR